MKKSYSNRRFTVSAIFIVVWIIFIARLFYLQIIDDSYIVSANRNVLRIVTQYPARGLIFDRNNKLLVYNEVVYDLMIIPNQVKEIDTLELCNLVGITKDDFIQKLEKSREYSSYSPSIFEKQISKESYGYIQEKLYKYRGFFVQTRTLRKYPDPVAAHTLGYIGEANEDLTEKDSYYKPGDYVGMSGLEKFYEPVLRGKKGSKIMMVDVFNREKGSFRNGMYDTIAIAGKDIYSSIDAELQVYGESLMKNKRGSIVAIDPTTGEILTMISSPSYDPNLLIGRVRGTNYIKLLNDPVKPLFDRTLMALYPPGSIFKIVQSLVALEEGVITENSAFPCDKSLVGCHNHPSATNLKSAIKMSCNPYFYQVFRRIIQHNQSSDRFVDSQMGLDQWYDKVTSFGLGARLGIDMPSVKKGFIPSSAFYNHRYGEHQWAFSTIYSLSIGQGEVGIIPLQMANIATIFANRGYYYTPHLIKYIGKEKTVNPEYKVKHITKVSDKYFNLVADAMYEVVNEPGGTASGARIDDIVVCGKTGTAQNPHGQDHSVFIAFAPMKDPKIAIAVYIENAGFGGVWAAPIASLMIEKYIKRKVKREDLEERMINANLMSLH
ncbi:MAG: penicillin-binding protein 2 [Bacteroidota bacterium]|jgi:penicillin-binding protein 2